MKLGKAKQKQLENAYNSFVQACLYDMPLKEMEPFLADDIMNFGAGKKEITKTKAAFLKQIKNQKKLAAGLKMDFKFKPVLRKIINKGNGAIYSDDILNTVWINGVENKLKFRLSYVFEYRKNKWVVVHSHTSTPDSQRSDDEVWPVEELKKRTAALEKSLDEKIAELEIKNHELVIEAALERVRTVAMSMKKSDELINVCEALYKELTGLGFANIRNAQIAVRNDARQSYLVCEYSDYAVVVLKEAPFNSSPIVKQLYDEMEKSKDAFYEKKFSGKEFDDWRTWRAGISTSVDSRLADAKSMCFYLYSIGIGHLGISTFNAITKEQIQILKRFKNVFELSYLRYMDVAQAEADAREAKIEASLEKLRGKAMAMHNSSDLSEAASMVFTELQKLGIHSIRAGVGLLSKDSLKANLYAATSSSESNELAVIGSLDMSAHPCLEMQYKSWLRKENYFPVLNPQELKSYYDALSAQLSTSSLPYKQFQHDEFGYYLSFSEGFLFAWSDKPYSENEIGILDRFKAIVDLTFRRYFDLTKAEAQAREAKIEASLERVRTKAMAMHKSEDLNLAVTTVFEELDKLNLETLRCGIGILHKETRCADVWTTTKSDEGIVVQVSGNEPMDIHPLLHGAFETWLKDEDFSYELRGEDLISYYEALDATNYNLPDDVQTISSEKKELEQYYFKATFQAGGLFAFRETPFPEEAKKVIKRFAGVFDLTYKRFLDIQKAEAQARESQIEAGLERVRSRTLAMQKSDELAETAAVVFKQLIGLGIEPNRLFIGIIKDDTGEKIELWATEEDGSKISTRFTGNVNRNHSVHKMYDGWKEKKKSITIDMQGKELTDYFHYLADELKVPFKLGLSQKRRVQSIAYFSKGFIGMASPDTQPEEALNLLERFAAVFNLTYARFNDLQQAETQAHEARIEAALERVRARALAMQQPEELKEVAQVLRHEMGLLGVEELETCSIYIHQEYSSKAECWYAIKDVKEAEKKLVSDHFALDFNDTWVGRQMLQFYNSKEKKVSIVMQGENRKEWIHYCEKFSVLLRGFYGDYIPDRTYHLYKFSNGSIGAATPGDISDESWSLLKRAASVFSLAYSRFRDLTQARIDLKKLKEEKKRAEDALAELQITQKQLVQSEKMASLGELTAGIAHEIQNPLNFVNNFSEVSNELIEELKEERQKAEGLRNTALEDDILNDIAQNLEKINHHGKRADAIVKGMLQHSRSSSAVKEPTNINTLLDEYIRLCYHGLRAKDNSFNATIKTDFDNTIEKINIIPQDIGRVILNLLTNAFYAVNERRKAEGIGYEPTVTVSSKLITPLSGGSEVEIKVIDNGGGIPKNIVDKIFQPFFTTKPTGQGTGLGLSLSYDIVKAHAGEIKVETKEGEGTKFIIELPAN